MMTSSKVFCNRCLWLEGPSQASLSCSFARNAPKCQKFRVLHHSSLFQYSLSKFLEFIDGVWSRHLADFDTLSMPATSGLEVVRVVYPHSYRQFPCMSSTNGDAPRDQGKFACRLGSNQSPWVQSTVASQSRSSIAIHEGLISWRKSIEAGTVD